ncbi:MAG: hypothetical protein Q8P39_02825 [Candidatus Yanofskybacteria bacterium]|nr:hypothetical protein [Candidatus Yanofskybacteria bacterium]
MDKNNFLFSLAVGFGISVMLLPSFSDSFSFPAAIPPGNNSQEPLHEGPAAQIRQGGLILGSIAVDANATIEGYVDLPAMPAPGSNPPGSWARLFLDTADNLVKIQKANGTIRVVGELPDYFFESSSGMRYKLPGAALY